MPNRRGRYIVIALVVLLALSSWRTLTSERARHHLAGDYQQAQAIINQLQQERATLTSELDGAKQTIAGHETTITNLQSQLQTVQARLDETATELASLRQEHEELKNEQLAMAEKMGTLQAEKTALEERLSSLKELRLAMRDVKHKLWMQRLASWQARIEAQREADRQLLASGNRGYVVHQGQSTLGMATTRLQVHVLEPESQ